VHVPYRVFATADGHVMAGTYGGESWPKFCAALGRDDLVDDARFTTNRLRAENRDALSAILEPIFAERTSDEWRRRFDSAKALFAPVLKISEILAHEQVRAAGFVQSVEHPTVGTLPQLAPPLWLSETPAALGLPPPLLGQHTDEVLGELDYTPVEIESLRAAGVIR
jgi:crotonobetainyl-CoA:carnitine CoA-transferase CaiB-like acyl-CoA transferase